MKNTIKLFVVIALVAIIGFVMAACSGGSDDKDDTTTSDGSGNGDGSNAGKSNWLPAHYKSYNVTDGVVGNVNEEYDITYTSYTDDKHYALQYSYTQPINTRNETASYTQTYVGSQQVSNSESRDGNTGQSVRHLTGDVTATTTFKDSSYTIQNNTSRSTSDYTMTITTVYDNDSGLLKSYTQQQTGTISGSSVNSSIQESHTIELLSTEGSVKTYKNYVSSYTSNGTNVDLSTRGYTVYKIQNGITLEFKSYTAAGVLSQTYTYSFTDNATIKSKLPNYTLYNYTSYNSDGSTLSTSYSTAEVVSDSNTELRILTKSYSNGKLSDQVEDTYRRR